RRGLAVAALHVGEDALPLGIAILRDLLLLGAVEQRIAHLRWQLSPRGVELELELLGEAREDHAAQVAVRLAPREHHTLEDRDARITEDEVGRDFAARAESGARGAGPERGV